MKDFCKEHYFHEIDRNRGLESRISLPAGVITIVGSVLVTVFKAINVPYSNLEWFFVAISGLAVFLLTIAVYYLCRSLVGFTYGYIASPLKVLEYEDQLKDYYQANGVTAATSQINTDVERFIKDEYAKMADLNTRSNDMKSYFLHEANRAIIAALILTFVASGPFAYNYMLQTEEPVSIRIVE
jgi:hypothetical protein